MAEIRNVDSVDFYDDSDDSAEIVTFVPVPEEEAEMVLSWDSSGIVTLEAK